MLLSGKFVVFPFIYAQDCSYFRVCIVKRFEFGFIVTILVDMDFHRCLVERNELKALNTIRTSDPCHKLW